MENRDTKIMTPDFCPLQMGIDNSTEGRVDRQFRKVLRNVFPDTWVTNVVDNPLSIKLCPLTVTPLTRFPKECFLLDCPGLGLS